MTIGSLKKILEVLSNLGFDEYYDYIVLSYSEMIQEMHKLDECYAYINDSVTSELLVEESNIILKDFYKEIKSRRLKNKYADYLLNP